MTLQKVYLIRHGETDWNAEHRWQGYSPTALNAAGFVQAEALAEYFRGAAIQHIVSSDLPRAFQTATALGQAVGVEPQVDIRWREINVGILEGHTSEEIQALYPEEYKSWRHGDINYAIPNGESQQMMFDRVIAAWKDVLLTPNAETVAVVSHGGAIRGLILNLFPEVDILSVKLRNTSITTVENGPEGWQVTGLNEVPHLEQTVE